MHYDKKYLAHPKGLEFFGTAQLKLTMDFTGHLRLKTLNLLCAQPVCLLAIKRTM